MRKYTDPIDLLNSDTENKKLYKHQLEAINSLDMYFDLSGKTEQAQNGLLVMPTGSGKTFTVVNWLLDRAVAQGFKVLWLVHRQELIEQTYNTFCKQAPILVNHGFKTLKIIPVSGGHHSMSQALGYDINICGIGSVASKNGMRYLRRMLGANGKRKLIVVIDEAHHAVSLSYRKVIQKISEINPNRLLLGLTATPYRMQDAEQGQLLRMFNVNSNIKNGKGTDKGYIYEVTLRELLLTGFLAEPVYKRIETKINGEIEFDLTEEDEVYFEKFGELSEHLKEQLAKSSVRNQIIVDEYIKHKDKYGKTLVFAVNRLHCVTLAKAFTEAGVSCRFCMSGEPGIQETIADFKADKFDVLINVQILTEGSDVPDIQTVFLTRQTNSDSLLMQMIGRGLRGVDAGGTKLAYIVDFHDTWDRFNFWLDPKKLIADEFGEVQELIDENEDIVEVNSLDFPNEPEENYPIWDLYLKMYSAMKMNITGISHNEIFPQGWYAVVNSDGEDVKVLVYDNQVAGYELIAENADNLLANKPTAQEVLKNYFDIEENLPKLDDIQLILDTLYELGEMPPFYTFKERDEVDAKKIAKKLFDMDLRRSEQEYKLKEMYDSTPIIRELYKTFFVFKHTVNDYIEKFSDGEPAEPQIVSIDERAEFNIVEDYFNLEELYNEVIEKWFPNGVKPEIRWSNKPLRSRFGLCTKYDDGSVVIAINKLLCSPDVPPDVIKYVIYHELLHANGYWNHDEAFRSEEWKYPNSDELDGFLDELFLRYKIDEIVPPRNIAVAPARPLS
ncbi:DEAD/DEAH box helicase family protein [Mahella sp.]|uniref:DEAD/DEAH box helicase family protein n=1 Tax=Mahella sp. TaxID=2798721 RepID=UPI0025C64829|nr:DEAD/DEAH box helicase family protein [Mahella sp.]MBZ4664866.1 box helicase family protein [Mahella sp.]